MSTIQCQLCPRYCTLTIGQTGDCRVRINLDNKLHTLVYGNPCAIHVDPIEKKPLYHFLPQSAAFSIATAGCNLHCKYCQNWQISQSSPQDTHNYDLPPQKVVDEALKAHCKSIAYTYSDPTIFYEYTTDTAKIAKQVGIKNILVTAAYINQQPLLDIAPHIDAANVDLKGMSDQFYNDMSEASLQPVLDALITMKKQNIWIEVTNLVVPTWNDSDHDFSLLAKWIVKNLGASTPLHFSRFWPRHQLKNLPPTPVETLIRAREIAMNAGLHYVYLGNIPDRQGNNTYCPHDKEVLIRREGFKILENNLINGKCKHCQTPIAGVWQ